MSMRYRWIDDPVDVFGAGIRRYMQTLMDTLYALMVAEAVDIQDFMRKNAPWEDNCMPGREYLKAVAFRDDDNLRVGVICYYDDAEYYRHCRQDPTFPFGIAHEMFTFKYKGVISIILPRRAGTVLGDRADELWDKVRVLMA